jgi:hypothetical protein
MQWPIAPTLELCNHSEEKLIFFVKYEKGTESISSTSSAILQSGAETGYESGFSRYRFDGMSFIVHYAI